MLRLGHLTCFTPGDGTSAIGLQWLATASSDGRGALHSTAADSASLSGSSGVDIESLQNSLPKSKSIDVVALLEGNGSFVRTKYAMNERPHGSRICRIDQGRRLSRVDTCRRGGGEDCERSCSIDDTLGREHSISEKAPI